MGKLMFTSSATRRIHVQHLSAIPLPTSLTFLALGPTSPLHTVLSLTIFLPHQNNLHQQMRKIFVLRVSGQKPRRTSFSISPST